MWQTLVQVLGTVWTRRRRSRRPVLRLWRCFEVLRTSHGVNPGLDIHSFSCSLIHQFLSTSGFGALCLVYGHNSEYPEAHVWDADR